MKVVKISDEDTKLTKRQRQQVAILKLTENGKYIENVGIKDNEFFLLVEHEADDTYLEFKILGRHNYDKDERVFHMVMMMYIDDQINKAKALLSGKENVGW
jgi:tRNA pseudouridine-54 N-methylase